MYWTKRISEKSALYPNGNEMDMAIIVANVKHPEKRTSSNCAFVRPSIVLEISIGSFSCSQTASKVVQKHLNLKPSWWKHLSQLNRFECIINKCRWGICLASIQWILEERWTRHVTATGIVLHGVGWDKQRRLLQVFNCSALHSHYLTWFIMCGVFSAFTLNWMFIHRPIDLDCMTYLLLTSNAHEQLFAVILCVSFSKLMATIEVLPTVNFRAWLSIRDYGLSIRFDSICVMGAACVCAHCKSTGLYIHG